MKWSWRIGTLAGIPVRMHATFLLILLWVVFLHAGQGAAATFEGIAFMLAMFGCVVLHELGHAVTARRFGIRTRDITLLPIGGVARLEHMPEKPMQELLVALAGPAVNVVIAAGLYTWLRLTDTLVPFAQLDVAGGPFLERLLIVNLMLVAFNLLPAFPMDGGRVLRALLATTLSYLRATQIAAVIGQGMAFLFGLAGLLLQPMNPFLLVIALFVWIGAAQEASMVKIKSALGGIPVRSAMQVDFRALSPGDTLGRAVEYVLAGAQQDFPVVDEGRVIGILTRHALLADLAKKGEAALVVDSMDRNFQVTDATEMLETAFARLQSCSCRTLPVLAQSRLVGLLTTENVGEFLLIQSALEQASASHRA